MERAPIRSETLLARLAVELELLDKERALEALRSYRSQGRSQDFATFLVGEDIVSEDGLAELLRAQVEFESRNGRGAKPASAERDRPTRPVAPRAEAPAADRPDDSHAHGLPPAQDRHGNGR